MIADHDSIPIDALGSGVLLTTALIPPPQRNRLLAPQRTASCADQCLLAAPEPTYRGHPMTALMTRCGLLRRSCAGEERRTRT
jgi:hypothetical protein